MPSNSDIQVQGIAFAQGILCNCPTTVTVKLINRGNAAPTPISADGRFEVCLTSPAFGVEMGNTYRQRALGGEGQHSLGPNQSLAVVFNNVVFLHAGLQPVEACADSKGSHPVAPPPRYEIGNNAHTMPCFHTDVQIAPAAWLHLDSVEIDLEDSLGTRNRNVTQLCPGTNFVAVATVRNRGCIVSPGFKARLTIRDQNGAQLAVIDQIASAVAPQAPSNVEFRGVVPVPARPGAQYTFAVELDVTQTVQPQCSRHFLTMTTAPIAVAQAGGAGPRVTLVPVNPHNYPGDDIPINWQIQNDCSDLGDVTARITLQGRPDVLYQSGSIPVPPLGVGGEQRATIPRPAAAAVANTLYQFGAKTLHIEVTGTGRNPGPYVANAPLVISPENIDTTWWSWDWWKHDEPAVLNPALYWKSVYDLRVTLANRGGALMNPAAVNFSEFDKDASQPTGRNFAVTPPLGAIAANASAGFVWSQLVQQWDWLTWSNDVIHGPTWVINQQQLHRDFGFQADLQLADEFGNPYNLHDVLDPRWEVTRGKIAAATGAIFSQVAAVGCFIEGLIAAAAPLVGSAIAAGFFLAAATAEALAITGVLQALDPPFPDFNYREPVEVQLRALPHGLQDIPADLLPLRSLIDLLNRAVGAIEALGRIRQKLEGARIDNDSQGLHVQADSYRKAEKLLQESAKRLPDTLVEALGALRARGVLYSEAEIRQRLDAVRQRGFTDSERDNFLDAGLTKERLERLETALRFGDWPPATPPFETALQHAAGELGRIARDIDAEMPTVLAGIDSPP